MDYHVRPLGKTCAATGEPLTPGTTVVSVLVERDGELIRLDYAEDAWTAPPSEAVGHWRSRVPAAECVVKPVDSEAVLAFFEQVLEEGNSGQEKMAYVLALWLLQRRRLRLEGTRGDDEIQYLQLVGSRGEGPYEVRDQQMSDEEIQRLQAEVQIALQSEWNSA